MRKAVDLWDAGPYAANKVPHPREQLLRFWYASPDLLPQMPDRREQRRSTAPQMQGAVGQANPSIRWQIRIPELHLPAAVFRGSPAKRYLQSLHGPAPPR